MEASGEDSVKKGLGSTYRTTKPWIIGFQILTSTFDAVLVWIDNDP